MESDGRARDERSRDERDDGERDDGERGGGERGGGERGGGEGVYPPRDPEAYLVDSILVVGNAGMASARSLAALGYDVRLAQLTGDEQIEIVWRSDATGITIELDDHHVEQAALVYLAEPVEKLVRVVRVARQIGAAVVWSPFADHDNVHRGIVEGAGLVFVAGADIVVVARRHLRTVGLARLELIEAQLSAHERWSEVSGLVAESDDRPNAIQRLHDLLGLSERAAHVVLDTTLGRRTKQAIQDLRQERDELEAALGGASPT